MGLYLCGSRGRGRAEGGHRRGRASKGEGSGRRSRSLFASNIDPIMVLELPCAESISSGCVEVGAPIERAPYQTSEDSYA